MTIIEIEVNVDNEELDSKFESLNFIACNGSCH